MAAVKINLHPTKAQLRQFGWLAAVALPLLGIFLLGRYWPQSWTEYRAQWLIGLAALAIMSGLAAWRYPGALKWPFLGLAVITFPIGLVVSELLLLLIYIALFVPIALVFRLLGRDALERRIDRQAATYWKAKPQPRDAASYFRQF